MPPSILQVKVPNTYCNISVSILTILVVVLIAHPPMVIVTPSSRTVAEGDSVTFTCLATGVGASNFTYEWLLNGSAINEQSYNITIASVSESTVGSYKCVVKNPYGDSGQSNTAILTLSKHSILYFIIIT